MIQGLGAFIPTPPRPRQGKHTCVSTGSGAWSQQRLGHPGVSTVTHSSSPRPILEQLPPISCKLIGTEARSVQK